MKCLVLALTSVALGDVISLAEYLAAVKEVEQNENLLSYQADELVSRLQEDTVLVTLKVVDVKKVGEEFVVEAEIVDTWDEANTTWRAASGFCLRQAGVQSHSLARFTYIAP